MSTLFYIFNSIQNTLFPWLEQALDPLSIPMCVILVSTRTGELSVYPSARHFMLTGVQYEF